MRTLLLLPVIGLTIAACHTKKQAAAATESAGTAQAPTPTAPVFGGGSVGDSLFFSIERTPCFGMCKAYHLDVYRSGFATYDGRKNMPLEGKHTGRIAPEMMAQLLAKAEEIGFFNMKDKYDGEVTDLPSTFIRVVANGKNKQVIGRVGQPVAFKEFAAFAEEQLLPLTWKPVVAEP